MKRFVLAIVCSFALYSLASEGALLEGTRQLTFEGKRSGEGYFSADGTQLVFQSEREADNPFYQIYLMDLETGDVERVSPGHGKTTCAWVAPDGGKVLFASTHLDPRARDKQREELEFRASGKERRYSWDYDEHFDLFAKDLKTGRFERLTSPLGYDAEASYSPDGNWIAFSSNRHAYTKPLTEKDAETFEVDKSFMLDIYIMRADGSDVRRLTDVKGYDGGPFFSANGEKICWRRFSEDGTTAEIYTMNTDGSDQRQLTRLGAMSWAPYFHPSGDYLVFATNKHGFGNFELYLVDAAGKREPVRVTDTDGFDGLPVFSPDGTKLAWTSNRTSSKKSQIFIADWNDGHARNLLKLNGSGGPGMQAEIPETKDGFSEDDLRAHVTILTAEAMDGRLTGTEGERLATDYVARVFAELGLTPVGDDGTFFQSFPFVAGVSLGEKNALTLADQSYRVDEAWRPLAFSETGVTKEAEIVFAGYGIKAPATDDLEEYDSFVHLDVTDKWLLVFRFMPEDISPERRRHMARFSSLRYKAMKARDLGAAGLLVINAPGTEVKHELPPLAFDASLAGTSIPAIALGNQIRDAIAEATGIDFAGLQTKLDSGNPVMGQPLEGARLEATVDILQEKRTGRNVVARLLAGDNPAASAIAIGAHVDHLGRGGGSNSLARDNEAGLIHHGADDNASGTAGLLEIAEYLAAQKRAGKLGAHHDVLFAAWSGEELGLLGSAHFANNYGDKGPGDPLSPDIAAYLNMDMIGRLREAVVIQGMGSSSIWPGVVERRNAPVGLSIQTQKDSYLPTDATSFYLKKVPILSAFTGSHEDYHSPRDTAEKLNYEGMRDIARFVGLVARGLARMDGIPEYEEMKRPENLGQRAALRAYLGTIPDYAQGDVVGLKLSGVAKGGPADQAGVRGGDVIVELAGKKIENIYDYTFAIEALKIGETTSITVVRGDARHALEITPGSRQ